MIFRGIFLTKLEKMCVMIYLSPKVGFLERFLHIFLNSKNNKPSTKNKKPSTETRNLLRKQEIPTVHVRTAFMCIYRSEYVPDSLTIVGAEGAKLGLSEAVFS